MRFLECGALHSYSYLLNDIIIMYISMMTYKNLLFPQSIDGTCAYQTPGIYLHSEASLAHHHLYGSL